MYALTVVITPSGCSKDRDAIRSSGDQHVAQTHVELDRAPNGPAREAPPAYRIDLPHLQPRLGAPLRGLTAAQAARFDAGRRVFQRTFRAEDGLGPVHNLFSCAACHSNPVGGSGSVSVTMFGRAEEDGFDPLIEYGGPLLQGEYISKECIERVPATANVIAQRLTTSALGAGLIEAIPADAILAHQRAQGGGVTGRAHFVRALEDPPHAPYRVGRFGWKAQLPTVLSFTATAAHGELGLTNRLLLTETAPAGREELIALCDHVPDPELKEREGAPDDLDRLTDFQRFLAPPPQTPRSGLAGEVVFQEIGCADCHTPSFTTADRESLEQPLRNRTIRPYSDFLLHDMGTLGDGIVQGSAGPREMRTPPLWGFRIRFPVIHDGRVAGATLKERFTRATRLHAGEAATSVERFNALGARETVELLRFMDSLGRVEFDSDGDNDVDHRDVAPFCRCLAGPIKGAYRPEDRCSLGDIDQDGDVDLIDAAFLQQAFTGDDAGSAMIVP